MFYVGQQQKSFYCMLQIKKWKVVNKNTYPVRQLWISYARCGWDHRPAAAVLTWAPWPVAGRRPQTNLKQRYEFMHLFHLGYTKSISIVNTFQFKSLSVISTWQGSRSNSTTFL